MYRPGLALEILEITNLRASASAIICKAAVVSIIAGSIAACGSHEGNTMHKGNSMSRLEWAPDADNGDSISLAPLRTTYRLNEAVELTVTNTGAKKQVVWPELSIKDGDEFVSADIEGSSDPFMKTAGDPAHYFTVPAKGQLTVRWHPLDQPKVFKPRVGSTYRFTLVSMAAVEGGGVVWDSTPFRLVK